MRNHPAITLAAFVKTYFTYAGGARTLTIETNYVEVGAGNLSTSRHDFDILRQAFRLGRKIKLHIQMNAAAVH